MHIDFRNLNTLWASILVETLQRLGLRTAIICPGSRSTPLTVAFAQHSMIEAVPILDERSAAFFALGTAKRTGLPAALVCTSGTAGANFYPAIIEAQQSSTPLLVLTADRPPELRNCHAGQTIDQLKLYGNYPNWQTELALPSADRGMLRYLRQTMVQAWKRSLFPIPGPVHINLPLRDPLAPIPHPTTNQLETDFFSAVTLDVQCTMHNMQCTMPKQWQLYQCGIIIAGVAHSYHPQAYCEAIVSLSKFLGFPVLAEALSPVRNWADLNPYLISTYDLILRDRQLAQTLAPEIVIQLGELPTSKKLRAWLDATQPQRWIVNPRADNFDPLHGQSIHLQTSVEHLAASIPEKQAASGTPLYLKSWLTTEARVRQAVDKTMRSMTTLFEGKAAWLLSQALPAATPVFLSNSMPVRDAEFFWQPNNSAIAPYFNRGANGIDGSLSTALGIAHRQSSVMLTGDLALLHDTNGFLSRDKFTGHLTIALINNNGGGIFEILPISEFDPPFEDYFATPQNINFARLCATYGVEHQLISSWEQLEKLLNPLPKTGIRVLELPTNRKADAWWRRNHLKKLIENIV